jgi:hypothetical protein
VEEDSDDEEEEDVFYDTSGAIVTPYSSPQRQLPATPGNFITTLHHTCAVDGDTEVQASEDEGNEERMRAYQSLGEFVFMRFACCMCHH